MPNFSDKSISKLATCDPNLQRLFHEVVHDFDCTILEGQRVIGEWIDFYNTERPHSALAGQTPAEAYGTERPMDMMDKPNGLPTSPQAQQQRQDVVNRILAA